MSKPTCKTCGGTVPDGHVPSMLDPQGVGHPNHSVQASDTSLGMTAVPPPADEQADDISQCPFCLCMTHSVNGRCGKCGAIDKDEQADKLNSSKDLKAETAKLRQYFYDISESSDRWKSADAIMEWVAAYSRTQTEAVLSDVRNWIDRNHYQPINESDRWVQASGEIMSHIDTEIARLRGEA